MKTVNNRELVQNYIDRFALSRYLSPILLENLQLKQLGPGEYLVAQGGSLNHLYLLVMGKLQVENYQKNGSCAVFSIERAFSVIGDLELFLDNNIGTVSTVTAITKVDILEISLSKIEQYAFNDPAFLSFICMQLSKKLYASTQLLTNATLPALTKVRKYLSVRAETEGSVIHLEKRDSIAALLGISTRQLNRILNDLSELNIIHFKNKTIRILNTKYLSEIEAKDFL
ncbi:Crp/Fnr family transcriptional regulator [Acinetobacter sp. NRRL B-65365]|uniref:Crp/Fnr family transcriptional regulator n=1 Tax=Acinetobacter sp. NRRL B-65365 TaxID=1785092 RepID=UPI0007A09AE2|nr:Crp/Fnr family transcriptional regulator [Acinetobacter sp. NRRL B-65365]KYQ82458.1 Crp/Fnr family transcriptional regulator [Acinetobacter sp. NRRL B-65365]